MSRSRPLSIRRFMLRMYWLVQKAVVPLLKSSQWAYYEKVHRDALGSVWLDIGCGHNVFGNWMVKEQDDVIRRSRMIVGIDLDFPGLCRHAGIHNRCMADSTILPFRDESFDLVTANMVMEHVSEPAEILLEVRRVLKPGGRFIFHTPNKWGYPIMAARCLPEWLKKVMVKVLEGRSPEDVFPTLYKLNCAGDIYRSASSTGLEVNEIDSVCSGAATAILGPFAIFELLLLRLLQTEAFRKYRNSLVTVLIKPACLTEGRIRSEETAGYH